MERYQLGASPRSLLGKIKVKRIRREGWTPAVMYGRGISPTPLQIRSDAFQQLLKSVGPNVMVDLTVEGNTTPETTMIKKIQRDSLSFEILNVDFHRVSLTDRITNRVPIELAGIPIGLNEGGILLTPMTEVEIRGVATDLPSSIKADISGLGMDDALHVRDLVLPEGIETLAPPDEIVAVVHAPRAAEVVAEAEEEAAPAAAPAEGAAAP